MVATGTCVEVIVACRRWREVVMANGRGVDVMVANGSWVKVHPLFATIYNSIHFLAKAVEATRRTGRRVTGTSVAEHARAFHLEGFCQPFSVTEDGDVRVPYVVLDTDGKGDRLWPVYGLEPGTRGLSYRGHGVHWPRSSSPGTDAGCWFESGSICNGGEGTPPGAFPTSVPCRPHVST
ncbi:hypothetical protein QYF61_002767 [Mycteria americana]|uniref:Uncharacterized protein n=1 Tax=Mycteria americana TaxID=33587 RepID=A0AAN7MGM7_MYCAM|nr:hypothetical protein QYF61_002767 [Mycteria americana]